VASESPEIVLYDIRDIVQGDTEKITELIDVIQSETSGPWVNLDAIGGNISTPLDGVLIVLQTEQVHHEISSLLADQRESLSQARAEGKTVDLAAQARQEPVTEYYQLDTETAQDLFTLIPEFIAAGTWSSTVDRDGMPVKLNEAGIGSIRKVAAGRKILQLGGQPAQQSNMVDPGLSSNAEDNASGTNKSVTMPDILVVPQSVLIITHKRSVHRQIRDFLQKLAEGSVDRPSVNGGFGGGGFLGGGGFMGGGGIGGLGGAGGGFYSVKTSN
jgi:hypothetical protein